jgi:hypothetical protein
MKRAAHHGNLWQTFWTTTIAATSMVLGTQAIVHAQATPAEIQSFPMPPTSGYAVNKTFTYVGDYGYYLQPSTAVPGMTANATDYRYVRYTGVKGKNLWVYGTWGTTPVPPATATTDACGHMHASYGVWVKYRYNLPLLNYTVWSFAGGGGMSGVRNSSGQCQPKVDNPLKNIDPRFGWGQEAINLNFKNLPAYIEPQEVVVGALANTHGWGSCTVPSGTFKACKEPAWIIGYTLP